MVLLTFLNYNFRFCAGETGGGGGGKIQGDEDRFFHFKYSFCHNKSNFVFQYGQQTFETTGVAFGSQATREYSRGSSPEWLHMQIGGGFERTR